MNGRELITASMRELERVKVSDAGPWIPSAQRPPRVYQPRARRACLGELVQRFVKRFRCLART
ncbi:hypothetical protein F4827_002981 [Paraburkholderia bannensis]|uniref:Uncharacterized protein n=1 Tax=Paraburkholderia bannensis TaxID=765414 RepID=A0A7W9TXB2_9BURK|nr:MULTISPECIES: hypothetical protein [Paraburkholderia]MBB3258113.1 hypothetical protein [Paraburkholderia sp. WP4_3_2]MBB6103126.1 hypothetical protein [Paraburkholderia bannensis]